MGSAVGVALGVGVGVTDVEAVGVLVGDAVGSGAGVGVHAARTSMAAVMAVMPVPPAVGRRMFRTVAVGEVAAQGDGPRLCWRSRGSPRGV